MAHSLTIFRRIATWVVVLTLTLAGILALLLWLAARPVLIAAASDYAKRPLCLNADAYPQGYPRALRPVQSLQSAEMDVFRRTCERHGIDGCHHFSKRALAGAAREAGMPLYRAAYLSECQIRALTLAGDMPLGQALHRLYPGRDPATLDNAELDCLAAVLRAGWSDHAAKLGRCTLPKTSG